MALFRRRPEIGDQRGERPRFRRRSPQYFSLREGRFGDHAVTVKCNGTDRPKAWPQCAATPWPQFRPFDGPSSRFRGRSLPEFAARRAADNRREQRIEPTARTLVQRPQPRPPACQPRRRSAASCGHRPDHVATSDPAGDAVDEQTRCPGQPPHPRQYCSSESPPDPATSGSVEPGRTAPFCSASVHITALKLAGGLSWAMGSDRSTVGSSEAA